MKKTTLKLLSTACAALLCASFASCKKDPVTPPSENPGEPSEIDSKPSVVGGSSRILFCGFARAHSLQYVFKRRHF